MVENGKGTTPQPSSLDSDGAVALALTLGFEMAGVVTKSRSQHMPHFRRWIAAGMHGTMKYLERADTMERRQDVGTSLDSFRSALVVAQSYADDKPDAGASAPDRATVARYARGNDYHRVMGKRLVALGRRIEEASGPVRWRAYVDTGPLLERELAERAGIGWFGKNTMLINPRRGSYFFLGVLLTDLPLFPSASFGEEHCGSCQRCIDACPTGALLGRDKAGAPVMDARRCISYLTIELKGAIPTELRAAIGNRIFGCDICQEVCPWNQKFARPTAEPSYAAVNSGLHGAHLSEIARRILLLSGKAFQRKYAKSPLARTGRNGMLRNLCVALGNWGKEEAVPVLVLALSDRSPLVRLHAAWALRQIGSDEAKDAIVVRHEMEDEPEVLAEMELEQVGSAGSIGRTKYYQAR